MCLPKKEKTTDEQKCHDPKALKKTNRPKQLVMMETEDKTQSEKERLDSALNVMGAAPNKNLVMALLSEQEKVKKTLNFDNFGDIGISYGKGHPGEDTILEKKTPLKYKGANAEERKKYQMQIGTAEKIEEEPTEENFMWNTKDIEYLAHSMMYTIDATKLTGSKASHVDLDPYGPLDKLESTLFDRHTLLVNTFVSCAKTFPNSDEVAEDLPRTAEEEGKPRRETQRLRWANPTTKNIPHEPIEYKTAEAPSEIETAK